jgi:hypothetical protein
MYTLIIPCAGNSTKFLNMRPKWMLTHPDGKLMVEKAIEGLNSNTFDRIIITILREHVEKYESELWLKQIFEDQVEVCIMEDPTFSETETVYKTLLQMKVKGPFCVKDSDGYIAVVIKGKNFVTGKDIRDMPELTNVPVKSFVLKNEQNILTDIIEKSVSSNHISIGLYGFGDAGLYIDKYLELSNLISTEEIYPSHIISSFIRGGAIFKYLEAEEYRDWGTVKEWRNDALKMSSYLVDIDGVVFRNKGKYGSKNWSSEDVPLIYNIKKLKEIQKKGGQLIFVTSRPEEFRSKTEESLKEQGLNWHSIVMSCHHSQRYIINDFASTNQYPSCVAINITRDGDNLEDFI